MTKSLNDRARDNWELLIAIADIAGGEWSERARAACQELSNIDIEQESDGILLLYDIRTIFSDKEVDKIFTEDLKKVLVTMDDRPWTEYISSWSITPRQIAKLLKPFGIRPKQMRIGATSKKGYELAWFADAFARYLDPYPPSQSETLPRHETVAGASGSVPAASGDRVFGGSPSGLRRARIRDCNAESRWVRDRAEVRSSALCSSAAKVAGKFSNEPQSTRT